MADFKPFTKKMAALVEKMSEEQLEVLADEADSSCTAGYDNDGSTGYEIFENGFELAVKAAGRPVFQHDLEDDESAGTCLFFFGTAEEVAARLQAILDEP